MTTRSPFKGQAAVAALFWAAALSSTAFAQDSPGEPGRGAGGKNPLKNVYFGEQHLHTSASPDAFAVGTRSTWEDAYRYARGEEVKLSTTGDKMKKSTPYDFVGITDHAEYFGVMPQLIDPKDPLSKSDFAKNLADPKVKANDPKSAVNVILGSILNATAMSEYVTPDLLSSNWQKYVETANKFNKPGKFTALIAFEWTSIPNGRNMHRNVYFRDDTGPKVPFSAFDSYYPQDLWTYQEIQRNEGHENLAIPHNGNVSDGWMFSPNKFLAGPMDTRYARRRQLNEPLFEMIQTKGASETNPLLSPNDEFAGFELFPNLINVGKPSAVKYGYLRQALADGLKHEETLGVNPFKFGIVAGADVHSSYSGNEEDKWFGAHGVADDTPKKRLDPTPNPSGESGAIVGSAGTTAIWAEENTRESLFDAMKRKETYGTSGTLIRLRVSGGWDYPDDLVEDKDFVKKAYDGGVAMGGDLPPRKGKDEAKAPRLAICCSPATWASSRDRAAASRCTGRDPARRPTGEATWLGDPGGRRPS